MPILQLIGNIDSVESFEKIALCLYFLTYKHII